MHKDRVSEPFDEFFRKYKYYYENEKSYTQSYSEYYRFHKLYDLKKPKCDYKYFHDGISMLLKLCPEEDIDIYVDKYNECTDLGLSLETFTYMFLIARKTNEEFISLYNQFSDYNETICSRVSSDKYFEAQYKYVKEYPDGTSEDFKERFRLFGYERLYSNFRDYFQFYDTYLSQENVTLTEFSQILKGVILDGVKPKNKTVKEMADSYNKERTTGIPMYAEHQMIQCFPFDQIALIDNNYSAPTMEDIFYQGYADSEDEDWSYNKSREESEYLE